MAFGTALVALGAAIPFIFQTPFVLLATACGIGLGFMVQQVATQNILEKTELTLHLRNFSWLSLGLAMSGFVGLVGAGLPIDHLGYHLAFGMLTAPPLIALSIIPYLRHRLHAVGRAKKNPRERPAVESGAASYAAVQSVFVRRLGYPSVRGAATRGIHRSARHHDQRDPVGLRRCHVRDSPGSAMDLETRGALDAGAHFDDCDYRGFHAVSAVHQHLYPDDHVLHPGPGAGGGNRPCCPCCTSTPRPDGRPGSAGQRVAGDAAADLRPNGEGTVVGVTPLFWVYALMPSGGIWINRNPPVEPTKVDDPAEPGTSPPAAPSAVAPPAAALPSSDQDSSRLH